MAELDALIAEQEELQLRGKTERTNSLIGYSVHLDWGDVLPTGRRDYSAAFDYIIDDLFKDRSRVVWADLGCGNGAAMRCAKIALEKRGIDPARLATYGCDLLQTDEKDLADAIKSFPREYPPTIAEQRYAPTIIRAPAETVQFPERPHIVTAHDSLFWMRDPLKAFANAAQQAVIGAFISVNRTHNLLYTSQPTGTTYDSPLFSPRTLPALPGFHIYGLRTDTSSLNLRKTNNIDDYSFGMVLRDPPVKRAGKGSGFNYLYCKKELLSQNSRVESE